jgi:hypothetical protein
LVMAVSYSSTPSLNCLSLHVWDGCPPGTVWSSSGGFQHHTSLRLTRFYRQAFGLTSFLEARRSKMTVTHNREQAAKLGDWTVRLEAGRVVDQGPTAAVLARADASV